MRSSGLRGAAGASAGEADAGFVVVLVVVGVGGTACATASPATAAPTPAGARPPETTRRTKTSSRPQARLMVNGCKTRMVNGALRFAFAGVSVLGDRRAVKS